MALRPLNSVVGYSVGANSIIQIIDAYGNVNTNVLTVENFANLGPVGNITIAGGASGQVLQTDGNGNLSWTSTPYITQVKNGNSNVSIPAANGNIYINATGTEQWVFDTTGTLTAPGNIITGSGTGGNITGVDYLSANTAAVNSLYTQRTAIPITTNTVVDQFPLATYRVAKYTIKVSDNTGFQAIEILLVHDSINSFITVYGSLSTTGIDLALFSTDLVGGNVVLLGTSVNASASVNLLGTYVPD
jgi:hypothetical protein